MEIGAGNSTIHKIQTTVDGGYRVTLDFGSDSISLIQKLMNAKTENSLVMAAFVEVDDE